MINAVYHICIYIIGVRHPEVRQLQADLDEGVRADAQLLDPPFAKLSEGKDVAVHGVGQRLGHGQRSLDLDLNLTKGEGGKIKT